VRRLSGAEWHTGRSNAASILKAVIWIPAVLLALAAGWLDWRYRRIPNWLTVPGLVVGVIANALVEGWSGAKGSLLGALLGLGLLLPLVLIKSLGAGDWKLAGAVGAFLGPAQLMVVLIGAVFVAGAMALVLIIYKRRTGQAVRNMGRMLAAIFTLHLPGRELTLDNPDSLKVPFGVAMAITVILYELNQALRTLK
jgi:prepilin peptidase CpaA